MTERPDNTPPYASGPEPGDADATVVVAPSAHAPPAPATVSVPPSPPVVPDTPAAERRETTSPLTASATRLAASSVQSSQPGRSPLWAVTLGAFTGLLLFGLTAALLLNR